MFPHCTKRPRFLLAAFAPDNIRIIVRRLIVSGVAAALAFLPACRGTAPPQPLSVAAAADLQFALAEGAALFHRAHPETEVRVSYGSSGNFYAQIRNGAPFDLFLSADLQYPRKLVDEHAVREDSLFVYAIGRLAVWVPSASALDPATALTDPAVHHLAIADPQHAPYGRAAVAALHSMGIYDSLQGKLVLGENISQTLQFAQSGAADAGMVALSLAMAPNMRGQGRYWEVPVESYPKMVQTGVILKDSAAAHRFREWLQGPAGRALLKRYGFSLPGE